MTDAQNMEQAQAQGQTEVGIEDFLSQGVKDSFKPKSSAQQEAIEKSVKTLCQQALGDAVVISDDAIKTIESIVAELDKKLTEQVNQILHHDDYQTLESTWRGLHYFVNNTETDETLKIKVFNISKKELGKTLKKFEGTNWDQSPLFKKIYEEEFGSPGGEPYGVLVGDYYFDHSPPDVSILENMAQISAASMAPFISSVNPSLMNMDSWQELGKPRDLTKIFQSAEYAPWRSLRNSEDARYIGLTMPRVLGRIPYGSKTNPVEGFAFEEDVDGADHSKYLWTNAAFAKARCITNSFKQYGWCSNIRGVESGGVVEGLPCHTFPTDDGGVDMKCPTEIAITDRREGELSKNGFLPLCHWKNEDYAAFLGAQSLQKPVEYDDPDATANANLSARLPYLFASNRFGHFLKCMVRDKVGSFASRGELETFLNNWIMKYVEPDPDNASQEQKARRPLAEAKVLVEEVEGNPGYYSSKFFLRPHYQLEGLTVSLRLVSKLPTGK